MLIAETHHLEADLSWVGLTRARWTRFLNRYVDAASLAEWLGRCKEAKGVTSLLWQTKVKRTEFDHTGGECLIALSYRPDQGIITVYSRETEFPMRGLLDASLIFHVAETIDRGPLKVIWLSGGLFVSLLHALPFLVHYDLLNEVMSDKTKAGKYLQYMTKHLTIHADSLRYGPAKRMLKRWRAMAPGGNGMALVPIEGLPLYAPVRRRRDRVRNRVGNNQSS